MDVAKITADIAKIEKNLTNPAIADSMKGALAKKLEALKKELQGAHIESEKKEDKQLDETNDEKKKLEKNIDVLKKGLNNKLVPEASKSSLRKKLSEAEDKLSEIEKSQESAAKEAAESKKEIKAAVKKVEAVIEEVKSGKGEVKESSKNKLKGVSSVAAKYATKSEARVVESKGVHIIR